MLQDWGGLSPVILGVLALLILFSIASWTILVVKVGQIRVWKRGVKAFSDYFWETKDLGEIHRNLARFGASPLAALFLGGYRETQHFAPHDRHALENLSRSLRKLSSIEIEKLEKGVSFLATTASTTPFIGLFGTVWGIMNAFQQIGEAGSTSLTIVAPGISEALLTTAIGLAVAIPAVVGYNFLQGHLRRLTAEIDNFCYDFLNLVQRDFPSPH